MNLESDLIPSQIYHLLTSILQEVKTIHPNMGERIIQGRPTFSVDHENTVARQSRVISRQVYSVPAVWNIDGNHKRYIGD